VRLSCGLGELVMVVSSEQEDEFILNLGRALVKWQGVEGAAYDLFVAFMNGADRKLVSVIFHNIQSFHTVITLLDRCAYFTLPDGPLKTRWEGKKDKHKNTGLRARLNDEVAIRNRIVHFCYHPGRKKGGPFVSLGPSFLDATYAINDRWKNPENEIDLERLIRAQQDFGNLAEDLRQFRDDFAATIAR